MEKMYNEPATRKWLSFDSYMLMWFNYTDSPSRFVVKSSLTSSSINDPGTNGEFLSFLLQYIETCRATYKGTYKYNDHIFVDCFEDDNRLFVVLLDDILGKLKIDGLIFYKKRRSETKDEG